MRKDEEVIELFYSNLENLKKLYSQSETKVSVNNGWVTIEFGTLYVVKGRGYRNALNALYEKLLELD